MKIKIQIPRTHIIGLQKIDDMNISLGILVDENILSLEFNDKYTKQLECKGPKELCSYASKALSDYRGLLSVNQLTSTIDEIDVNLYEHVLVVLKLLIEKKSFTMSDVLILKSELFSEYELDPVIACTMYFGGINLAIWRNIVKPSCLRLPSTNKYVEEVDREAIASSKGHWRTNLVSIALSLWLNEFTDDSVIAYWNRMEKYYRLIHSLKPKPNLMKPALAMIPIEVLV